jgi:hypothetical protein
MTVTDWNCNSQCESGPMDKYPSCKTEKGKKMYCIGEYALC